MKRLLLLYFLGITGFISAEKNIVDLATELKTTELVTLIKEAGLTDTLSGTGPFTVFAPSDDAFKALPQDVVDQLKANKSLLTDVLKYHVLSGKIYSTDLVNDATVKTLDSPSEVRTNIYGEVTTVNGAKVINVNQNASNGVIHVIDKVLYPIISKNVMVYVADMGFSTLLYTIVRANLEKTLTAGPYTVFAPTDDAFNKLPVGFLSDLLSNQTALVDVLTYHVVSGTLYSAGITDGAKVQALNNKTLTFKVDKSGVTVDSSKISKADDGVTNGVVHVIDAVLLPPKYHNRNTLV